MTITCTALGCIIKYLAGPIFGLALFANFFVSATNILTLTACLTVPAEWFPPELQVRSITISGMANIVGMGYGLIASVYLSIPTYSLISVCISSVCLVAFLLTGRVSPKKQEFSTTFKETVEIVRRDCKLVTVIMLSSTIIGVIYTYIGILSAILEPEGLSTQDIGLSGGFFVISGIFGSSFSNWIGETRGIAVSFRTFLIPSMVLTGGLAFATSNFIAFSFLNVFSGFFIQGTMMISLSAISFNSFPADESIVSCSVYVLANLISLVCNFIVLGISEATGLSQLLVLAVINAGASLPLVIIYRQYNRAERKESEKSDAKELSMEAKLIQ
mmetsp:Transcript_25727/g.45148  ORF Transcript_25727/g.45148 Transcript_25727/m.45148 type:complete len:330 (+) Transcript_25727:2168-3157(+)